MNAAVQVDRPRTRWEARSEETLMAPQGGVLTEANILRAFDRRRRDLAQLVTLQSDGLFVGYDVLELSAVLSAARTVQVCAVLSRDLGTRHAVEYRVEDMTHPPRGGDGSRILARATGWTLVPGRGPDRYHPAQIPPARLASTTW